MTEVLTPSELASGRKSELFCAETPTAALRKQAQSLGAKRSFSSTTLAMHREFAFGTSLIITGTACNGGGISLPAGNPWNDRIRFTQHGACSDIKHWVHADYTGDTQITQSSSGDQIGLNSTLAGQVSAIRYYGD